MWYLTDISPPSHQADTDPFANFLSTTPAAPAQAATPAGSEMLGSIASAATPQTQTNTKDAIMALYGNSTTAMAAGPYGMPPAGV